MDTILILGTGALAVLFAARLGTAGTPVTLLGNWEAGLAALRRNGARLRLPGGGGATRGRQAPQWRP
jgi:ketopantoate reductase